MRRGEVWTASGSGGYAGKPRPVVIVQADEFGKTETLTLAALTTDATQADLFRVKIEPSESNGLRIASHVMVDKITTLPKARFGRLVGRLSEADVKRLDEAVVRFLGLAGTMGNTPSLTSPA